MAFAHPSTSVGAQALLSAFARPDPSRPGKKLTVFDDFASRGKITQDLRPENLRALTAAQGSPNILPTPGSAVPAAPDQNNAVQAVKNRKKISFSNNSNRALVGQDISQGQQKQLLGV